MSTAGTLFKGETQPDKSSLKTLYDSFRQTIEDMTTQVFTVSITSLYILVYDICVVQHVLKEPCNTLVCT